jgi:hypothetical protein
VKTYLKHIDQKRIQWHILFWCIWVGGFTMLQSFGYGIEVFWAWLVYYLITLPLFVAHAYAIAYWLVPKYFFRSRYLIFSCWIFVLLILSSIGELWLSNELIWEMVKPEYIQQGNYFNWQNVLINGLGNEYIVIVFLSVKVIRLWNSKILEKTELLNRKLATEIELIQYQSYPRFVINVIDRLEQLAISGSSQTSEMIIGLSNLMNSMVTFRRADKILLYKEIEIIRSYIDIQQLNFQEGLILNFNVSGEPVDISIPPFLFFRLIEEGFSLLETNQSNSEYIILMKPEPNYLLFSMTLWNPDVFEKNYSQAVLDNCKKYLSYFYPESHKVNSNFETNFVEITIEIYY